MPNVFYALVVCFIFNWIVYVYWCTSVFLVFCILSIILLFISFRYVDCFICEFVSFKRYLNSKKNYKEHRKMAMRRRLNLSEKEDSTFTSGLISGYDSKMNRSSFMSGDYVSPVRTSKYSAVNYDENYISRKGGSPNTSSSMLSPIRPLVDSPHLSSPLAHSRRYNSELRNYSSRSPHLSGFTRLDSTSNNVSKRTSSFSDSLMSGSPRAGSRLASTANEMGVDDFPWVCPTVPMIPMIQSPTATSPHQNHLSTTPRRNRVRVKLTPSHNSDITLNTSSLEASECVEEPPSTVKTVIQVLKEMSRKRSYMPAEDNDENQQEAKRRPEHNMYLSRLECGEETPPVLPPRINNEDERKRIRDADWESPTSGIGPKRRRTNTYVVNNEILSSLSSSIGLRNSMMSPVEKSKQMVSIGTQVTFLKNSPDKKQTEQSAQTNFYKPPKEVKEASTMPDPPQPPSRPRSPVKEKVVSNPNIILKSALSKFKIQPKDDSKKTDDISAPLSFTPPAILTPSPSSTVVVSPSIQAPIPVTAQQNTTLSLGVTPFSSAAQSTLTNSSSKDTVAVSSALPPYTFGSPTLNLTAPVSKTNSQTNSEGVEAPKAANTEPSLQNVGPKPELSGFKFNTSASEVKKPESNFNFGVPQASQNVSAPSTQPAPMSETSKPSESSAAPGAAPFNISPFTFGTKSNEVSTSSPFVLPKAPEPTTTSAMSPVSSSSAQSGLKLPETSSGNTLVPFTSAPAMQPFKFENKTEKISQPVSENKTVNSTNLFAFGKVENKTDSTNEKSVTANNPFQFGGTGSFSFGQADKTSNKDAANSSPFAQTFQSSTVDSSKPVFSFGGTTKQEEKSGGFPFKLPSTDSGSAEQKPAFSFMGTKSSAPTTSSNVNSTAPSGSTPMFPSSLFGTTSAVSPSPNNTVVSTSQNTGTSFAVTSTTSSAPSAFGSVTPSFSANTSMFPGNTATTTASTPLFGSSSNTKVSTPIFGGGLGSSIKPTGPSGVGTTSVFGSSAGSTGASFGSSNPGTTPSFGNPMTANKVTTFGSGIAPSAGFGNTTVSTSSTTPAFGSSTSTFGSTASGTSASTFGSTTTSSSIFGGANTTASPAPAFATNTSTPLFGGTPALGSNVSAFGSNTAAPAFSSTTTPSFGGASNPTPPFGSQPGQGFGSQPASTFGNAPAFGAQNAFGSQSTTPAFGSPSTFGNSSTAPAFGSSNTTAPTFGTSNTTAPAPAFGTSNTTAPAPTFGSSNTTAPAPTFGSSNTTAPAPTFGTSNTTAPAPSFGSTGTTTFGASTFGGQEAGKPFSFNAPTAQPATQSFNFSATQQPSQSNSGMFQFGTTGAAPQPNQPFQFNAAQPTAPVGGGAQQMFSIGSGSTAPRRMTARRKK